MRSDMGLDNQCISGAAPSDSIDSKRALPVKVGSRNRVGSHHILGNPVSVALFNSLFKPSVPSFRHVIEKAATKGPHAAGLLGPSRNSARIDDPNLPCVAKASRSQNSHVKP